MQIQKQYATLYTLKQKATTHINNKKYTWASVYLIDALKQFQSKIDEIEDEQTMEKLIRDIKVPCQKNLSLCYLKQNNYSECLGECIKVLEIQPNCVKILFRAGICAMALNNDLDSAQKYLKKAFFLDPTEKQVMKALQKIQEKKNQKRVGKKVQKQSQNNYSIVNLLKLLFIWPFLVMTYLYTRAVKPKQRKQ